MSTNIISQTKRVATEDVQMALKEQAKGKPGLGLSPEMFGGLGQSPDVLVLPKRMLIDKTGSLPSPPPKDAPIPPMPNAMPKQEAPAAVAQAPSGTLQVPQLNKTDHDTLKDLTTTLHDIPAHHKYSKTSASELRAASATVSDSAKQLEKLAETLARKQWAQFGNDREVIAEQIKLLEKELGEESDIVRVPEAQEGYYIQAMKRLVQKTLGQELNNQFAKLFEPKGLQHYLRQTLQYPGEESWEMAVQVCGIDAEALAEQLHSSLTVAPDLNRRTGKHEDIIEQMKRFSNGVNIYKAALHNGAAGKLEYAFQKKYGTDLFSYAAGGIRVSYGEIEELFELRFGIGGFVAAWAANEYLDKPSAQTKTIEYLGMCIEECKKKAGALGVCTTTDVFDAYFKPACNQSFDDVVRTSLEGKERTETLKLLRDAREENNRNQAKRIGSLPGRAIENAEAGIATARKVLTQYCKSDEPALKTLQEFEEKEGGHLADILPYLQQQNAGPAEMEQTLKALAATLEALKEPAKAFAKECTTLFESDPHASDLYAKLVKKRHEQSDILEQSLKRSAGLSK